MHRQKARYVQQVGACLFKDLKTRTTNKHNIILVFAFTLVDHTANCFWKYWFSNAPSPGDFLSPPCGWPLTPLVLCAGPSPSSNTQSLCIKTQTYAQHGLNPFARSHEGVLSNSFNHRPHEYAYFVLWSWFKSLYWVWPVNIHNPLHSLLLVLFDEAFGFAVLALQRLILRLRLLQVFVHRLAQALSLHPIALQLLHPLLILSHRLLQLSPLHPPAQLILLSVSQLERDGEIVTRVNKGCLKISYKCSLFWNLQFKASKQDDMHKRSYLPLELLDLSLGHSMFYLELETQMDVQRRNFFLIIEYIHTDKYLQTNSDAI